MKANLRAIVFLVKGTIFYILLLASAAETIKYSIDANYRIDEGLQEALNEVSMKTGNL